MKDLWPPLLPSDVKTALDEFSSWGAVVEHFLFAAPAHVDTSAHQLAAQSGLTSAVQTAKRHTPLWQPTPVDDSRLASGRNQHRTPEQFFGPCYDINADILVMRGQTAAFLNHYFHEGQRETHATAISQLDLSRILSTDTDYATIGYAQALFEPPYSLHNGSSRATNHEIATAFRRLCISLFGDLNTLEIYSWPTDCCNYFDAGH